MNIPDEELKKLANSSEAWLRGKIDDAEVDKCVKLIVGANNPQAVSVANEPITGVTGSILCVVFYWRATLDTPGHHYVGNAGGIGSIGAGAIQGGVLVGVPNLNVLYSTASAFQFNSAVAAVNLNFFDGSSNLVGTFIGGGVGICLGTGGGSGSWS